MKPSRASGTAVISCIAFVSSIALLACGSEPASPEVELDASVPDQSVQRSDAAPESTVPRDARAEVSTGNSDGGAREAGSLDAATESEPADAFSSLDSVAPPADSADTSLDASAAPDADASVEMSESGAEAAAPPTTLSILAAQGDNCVPCAQGARCLDPAMGGGACEDTPGSAPAACQATLNAPSPVTESQVCLATLQAMFSSSCAASAQGETPCVCGVIDPSQCLAGSAAPAGAVMPYYQCDFPSVVMLDLMQNFTNQARGAGQANALVQCLDEFCGSGSCFP